MNKKLEDAVIDYIKYTLKNLETSGEELLVEHQGWKKKLKDMTPEEKKGMYDTMAKVKAAWLDADYFEMEQLKDGSLKFSPKKRERNETTKVH